MNRGQQTEPPGAALTFLHLLPSDSPGRHTCRCREFPPPGLSVHSSSRLPHTRPSLPDLPSSTLGPPPIPVPTTQILVMCLKSFPMPELPTSVPMTPRSRRPSHHMEGRPLPHMDPPSHRMSQSTLGSTPTPSPLLPSSIPLDPCPTTWRIKRRLSAECGMPLAETGIQDKLSKK